MHLWGDLRTGAADISEYLNAWLDHHARSCGKPDRNHLAAEETRAAVRDLCAHMYENLSILDAKGSGLIGSNAATTAILSVLAFAAPTAGAGLWVSPMAHTASLVLLAPSLLALGLNVSVLHVFWSSAREISEQTGITDRARMLLRIRNERTKRYRLAFWLHMLVLVIGFCTLAIVAARNFTL